MSPEKNPEKNSGDNLGESSIEVVLQGDTKLLTEAKAMLSNSGIESSYFALENKSGVLRVTPSRAEEARKRLVEWLGSSEGIITQRHAYFWVCVYCDGPIERGEDYCPTCRAFIGDPHSL